MTAEELDEVEKKERKAFPKVNTSFKNEASSEKGKKNKLDQIIPTNIWQMTVAGLIGAVIAWLFNEFLYENLVYRILGDNVVLYSSIFGLIIAFIISFSFGSVRGILNKAYEKILKDGFYQGGLGALGGLIGGFSGQIVYSLLGGGYGDDLLLQITARTLGWSFLGLGIGLANGLVTNGSVIKNKKKIINGLIGGLIGGAIGGILFDLLAGFFYSGAVSRLIGFLAIGGMIGFMISLINYLRKEAWLSVEAGPLNGKQFILFDKVTSFGGRAKADIVLFGDSQLPPIIFKITEKDDSRFLFETLTDKLPIYINNQEQRDYTLKKNDIIQVGKHRLKFEFSLKDKVK